MVVGTLIPRWYDIQPSKANGKPTTIRRFLQTIPFRAREETSMSYTKAGFELSLTSLVKSWFVGHSTCRARLVSALCCPYWIGVCGVTSIYMAIHWSSTAGPGRANRKTRRPTVHIVEKFKLYISSQAVVDLTVCSSQPYMRTVIIEMENLLNKTMVVNWRYGTKPWHFSLVYSIWTF